MDAKDIRNLSEAYLEVYASQEELDEGREGGRFEYNQRHGRPYITPEISQRQSSKETLGGGTYERGPQRLPKSKRKYDRQVLSGVRAASDQEKQRARKRMGIGENYDLYDIILSHLLDEGYAETVEAAEVIMVNMSEEQLDEISLKTKMKAYAATQDPEADYAYGSKVHAQGDRLRAAIVKKHGEKAGDDADAHADASHWGRKDASGKKKGFAQSRTDTPNKYRTRADGKMHGQDQNKLKAKLKRRMGIGEEYDIYDIILSHLLDEGYAETPEAAQVIMVNMSEEWREEIMEGMTMKDFKANRQKNKRRAASADAAKRGHVGKEWYNSGRRYTPDEAKRMRSNLDDEERRTRHRSAVEPDNENDDDFSADKTKNPKKLRKQRAMGEHG